MAKSKIARDLESCRNRAAVIKKQIADARLELKEVSKQVAALEKEDAAARRTEFATAFENALRKGGVKRKLSRELAIALATSYITEHPEEVTKDAAGEETGEQSEGQAKEAGDTAAGGVASESGGLN